MSTGARIGVVVATIAVLVLAFVLLSPEADKDSNTAQTPTTTAPATTSEAPATTATTATAPPAADHEPAFQTIRVTGGQPSGGIKKITLKQNATARIRVSSPDTSDEIHLHGYDLKRDLKAGGSVRFEFKADAEGIFEIELEGAGVQIGELTVEP
jgi:heme/copper-type cytochrome/quinol oxidase subunit 2